MGKSFLPSISLRIISEGRDSDDTSITFVALNRRCLRRVGSGDWRLFAWRLSGFDCARIYRGAIGIVARGLASLARVVGPSRGWDALSGDLVNYRSGDLRCFNKSHQPPASLTLHKRKRAGVPARAARGWRMRPDATEQLKESCHSRTTAGVTEDRKSVV